jgi:hypothetical protein
MNDSQYIRSLVDLLQSIDGGENILVHANLLAIAKRLEAMEWQPIETAPKTIEIDCWNGGRLTDVMWVKPCYAHKSDRKWCKTEYDCNGQFWEEVRGITHWMPLPAPPKGAA